MIKSLIDEFKGRVAIFNLNILIKLKIFILKQRF